MTTNNHSYYRHVSHINTLSRQIDAQHRYHDDTLLLVVLLSESLGDDFDHDVWLHPVICSDRVQLLLLPCLHLKKKEKEKKHSVTFRKISWNE